MVTAKAVIAAVLFILLGGLMFGLFTRGPVVVELHPPTGAYDLSILRSAPNWTLPLDLRGAPFGGPADIFAARAADWMETPIGGLTLRLDPFAEKPARGDRIVAAFSDRRGRVQDVCDPPTPAGPMPAGAKLWLNAALCRGDRSVTAASGALKDVSGPGDERLPRLCRDVMRALFPLTRP